MSKEIDLIWLDYISLSAFDRRMVDSNFTSGLAPEYLVDRDRRKTHMSKLTYKAATKELQSLMLPEAYKTLNGAFRAFKYKRNKSLATINIETDALGQLQRVRRELGLDDHDNSYSDVILWLTSPPVRREEDTLQALFNANNNDDLIEFGDNPTASTLRQLALFQSRLSLSDQQLLKKIVEHSFVNGWRAKKGTRSDATDRIEAQLQHDEIFNISSDFKQGNL